MKYDVRNMKYKYYTQTNKHWYYSYKLNLCKTQLKLGRTVLDT
jgi:hypothetical protein